MVVMAAHTVRMLFVLKCESYVHVRIIWCCLVFHLSPVILVKAFGFLWFLVCWSDSSSLKWHFKSHHVCYVKFFIATDRPKKLCSYGICFSDSAIQFPTSPILAGQSLSHMFTMIDYTQTMELYIRCLQKVSIDCYYT